MSRNFHNSSYKLKDVATVDEVTRREKNIENLLEKLSNLSSHEFELSLALMNMNEILEAFNEKFGPHTRKNLAEELPKEINGFFSEILREYLNVLCRKDIMRKDSISEPLSKEVMELRNNVHQKIPGAVTLFLNEILHDLRKHSDKDFSKVKY